MDESKSLVIEQIQLILYFGLMGVLINWLAYSKGYFFFQKVELSKPSDSTIVRFKQVAAVFLIYLGLLILVGPLIGKVLKKIWTPTTAASAFTFNVLLQLFVILISAFALFLYCRRQDRKEIKRIWKDSTLLPHHSWAFDFSLGILSWFISFPIVVVVGQTADLLLYVLFGFEGYEQVAVQYLKMTLTSPLLLSVALFTVIITAPVIEEFLFRGFLQNYLKRYLGKKAAILSSSLCFALFHLAPSQGLGNISLAISLFIFACFLGFIYERQKSLFASIGLHMTFNLVSTLRILFIQE